MIFKYLEMASISFLVVQIPPLPLQQSPHCLQENALSIELFQNNPRYFFQSCFIMKNTISRFTKISPLEKTPFPSSSILTVIFTSKRYICYSQPLHEEHPSPGMHLEDALANSSEVAGRTSAINTLK